MVRKLSYGGPENFICSLKAFKRDLKWLGRAAHRVWGATNGVWPKSKHMKSLSPKSLHATWRLFSSASTGS